jgi:pimeloyl-ACP methyl ester carboxylesterase
MPETGKQVTEYPVIIFLHEGLGCIEHWKDFPEKLCREVGLYGIIYDRKGYGGSDPLGKSWSKDYLLEEADRDFSELLKTLEIKNAVLVGHSDGGSIALLAAAINPLPIKGVITEAAHVLVENETVRGIRKFMTSYEKSGLKKKLYRFHRENTEEVVRRWSATWLNPDFFDWNIEHFLPKIICPLLAIQGENDEYATVKQLERILHGVAGPSKSEILSNCGHTPHFQAQRRVLSLMSSFITSLK